MKEEWRRINWTGLLLAMVLLWYGWLKEPLAAVLGGMILFTNLFTVIQKILKKLSKNVNRSVR